MPSVSLLSLFSLSVCPSHTDEVRAAVGGDEDCRRGRQCKRAVMYDPAAGQVDGKFSRN